MLVVAYVLNEQDFSFTVKDKVWVPFLVEKNADPTSKHQICQPTDLHLSDCIRSGPKHKKRHSQMFKSWQLVAGFAKGSVKHLFEVMLL